MAILEVVMAKDSGMKISIITPTFNSQKYLEDTIRSVIRQTYSNIEYIIIDGGSTDRTPEIVEKYADKICRFVSEPDQGIYDAFNKGIGLATGDVIYFLNSDDYLAADNIIEAVAEVFLSNSQLAIVYGNVLVVDKQHGYEYVAGKMTTLEDLKQGRMCPHQGVFTRRELFTCFGLFDLSYRIAGDFDFVIKCFAEIPEKMCYIKQTIAIFREGGESSAPMSRQLLAEEQNRIIKKHFGIQEAIQGVNNNINGLYKLWLEALLLQDKGISRGLHKTGVRNVAVFGTRKTAYYLYQDLKKEKINVVCFLDNNENMHSRTIYGVAIFSPRVLLQYCDKIDAILLSIESYGDVAVKENLKELLIGHKIPIYSWKDLVQMAGSGQALSGEDG
jgi:glycosyltransferase involved in cell wall biosynthesis